MMVIKASHLIRSSAWSRESGEDAAPPLSIPPENIIIAGDSAGGGLSLALCMYLRDEGYQLPAGLILMSPWVDLTMSCGNWEENMAWDVVPRPEADGEFAPPEFAQA